MHTLQQHDKGYAMLVIVSDLHLTDGTSGATVNPGAFEILAHRLSDVAVRASWRGDGGYRPIDRIDLVLLGDTLDMIRSTRWLHSNVRPWHDVHSPAMVDVVTRVADDILTHNSESLSTLRQLAAEGAIKVPMAAQSGQPDYHTQPISIPVRTHYMVGNHDWHLHLRGASYDLLRQKVAHHFGLANSHTAPFPHDPHECEELLETLRRHRVFARHGDIFDPLNFNEDRDSSSLGDAIVIELVGRFIVEVSREMADDLPAAVAAGLAEIDNIRPLLLIPAWIDGMLERSCPSPAIRKQLKKIWDRLADEFLQLPMVRECDAADLIDGLESALKFSQRPSIGWASRVSKWLHSLRGASGDSYYQHALAEQDFRNRRARHIVYGHTHTCETIPLDASYADAYVLNQMYFNAGTWRRTYRPTILAPSEHEFIPTESMTYLTFFQGDERGGRPFETWTGTLGLSLGEPAVTRGEQPVSRRVAQGQQAAPARTPINPPHFAQVFAQQNLPAGH